MRRVFTQVRTGRPGPALVEIPGDVWREEIPEPLNYTPTYRVRTAPEARTVDEAAAALLEAERPVIYAG
jgi:acetolactate synthase-1/2/3 large subunit